MGLLQGLGADLCTGVRAYADADADDAAEQNEAELSVDCEAGLVDDWVRGGIVVGPGVGRAKIAASLLPSTRTTVAQAGKRRPATMRCEV